jgi:hypothetical protein
MGILSETAAYDGGLHFLFISYLVMSAYQTCKTHVEGMLDAAEVVTLPYGGRLTRKRSMARIHSGLTVNSTPLAYKLCLQLLLRWHGALRVQFQRDPRVRDDASLSCVSFRGAPSPTSRDASERLNVRQPMRFVIPARLAADSGMQLCVAAPLTQ